jgi:phage repressor protein C with HTH and peptisase S24 domain
MTIVEEDTDAPSYAFNLQWLKAKVSRVENALLIEVEGDSMLPIFRNGDVVMLDLGANTFTREGFYGLAAGDVVQVKQLTPLPNKGVRVTSNNPDYYDYSAKLSELKIVGRVIWHDRSLT